VFGNLRTWGWITLIIGALPLLAGGGVLAGNQAARWFAVAVLGLSAIDQMFFFPAYPVLVPHDHRGRRGGAVWTVRLRQPRESSCLAPQQRGRIVFLEEGKEAFPDFPAQRRDRVPIYGSHHGNQLHRRAGRVFNDDVTTTPVPA
jgi:hypothetical protein